MKITLKVLLLTIMLCCVTSCKNDGDSNNSESISISENESISDSASDSNSNSDSSSQVEDDPYFKLPNWEITSRYINTGDDLIDINVSKHFVTGLDYVISFTLTDLPNDPNNEVVESSNPEVFTVEKAGGKYNIHCLHEGDAMIRIKDSNGIVRYCNVVYVRDPIALDDMEEYLVYGVDYWVSTYGFGDSYELVFYENGLVDITCVISNNQYPTYTASYEYVGDSPDKKEYMYEFTDKTSAELSLTGFNISKNGDMMYLQDRWGTAALMKPNK